MSKRKSGLSGFQRRMGYFRYIYQSALRLLGIAIVAIAVGIALSLLSLRFDNRYMDLLIGAAFLAAFLLAFFGLIGLAGSVLMTLFEAGASGLDWVFGRIEGVPEKSKRKMKSDE